MQLHRIVLIVCVLATALPVVGCSHKDSSTGSDAGGLSKSAFVGSTPTPDQLKSAQSKWSHPTTHPVVAAPAQPK